MKTFPIYVLSFVVACASVACGSAASSGDAQDAGGGSTTAGNADASTGSADGGKSGRGSGDGGVTTTTPSTVTALAVGGEASCALLDDGTVRCWGEPFMLSSGAPATAAVDVGVTGAVEIAVNLAGCARKLDGSVWCWGPFFSGDADDTPAAQITGIANATQIAVGDAFGCAVLADHTVACWGANNFGQLGDGTATKTAPYGRRNAAPVTGITNATAVTCGNLHACALLSDATVECWGYNFDGRLGDGTTVSKLAPVAVQITGVTAIAAGGSYLADENPFGHTCAATTTGAVQCWGGNTFFQLGVTSTASCNGESFCQSSPVAAILGSVPTPSAVAVVAGGSTSCALTSAGRTFCWGDNSQYNYGDQGSAVPVEVAFFANALSVGLGTSHTCVLQADHSVWCLGNNDYGQLGVANPTTKDVLHRVNGLP